MSKKNQKVQFVEVCLRDGDGNILLSAGRRPAKNEKDGDSVYFRATRADGDDVEVSVMLDEAEDYLDAVTTLVSDVDARPFHGSLAVDTRAGRSGGQIEIRVDTADDRTADLRIQGSDHIVEMQVAREPLERFLFAVREGICEDLEDDG